MDGSARRHGTRGRGGEGSGDIALEPDADPNHHVAVDGPELRVEKRDERLAADEELDGTDR